jgi:hypothetical protein
MDQGFQREPIQLSLFDSDWTEFSLWKVESSPTISKSKPSAELLLKIKDLPPSERPRERLLEYGAKH